MLIAWWIAFGPHGPRAETPPGEWTKVWLYTATGIGLSAVLFFTLHSFARPPPRTMTKEWQEATNEYLKVSPLFPTKAPMLLSSTLETDNSMNRPRRAILSMVLAAKDIKERATFRASRPRPRALNWRQTSRPGSLLMSNPAVCTVTSILRKQISQFL